MKNYSVLLYNMGIRYYRQKSSVFALAQLAYMVPQIITFGRISQATITNLNYQWQLSKDYVNTLLHEIEILRTTKVTVATATRTPAALNMDVSINTDYVHYIEVFGPPEDGIFLPSRMEEIRRGVV